MVRELGVNPRKLGRLANYRQKPWKAPLPVFIERIYEKRFGKARPDRIFSVEERVREGVAEKAKRCEGQAGNDPTPPVVTLQSYQGLFCFSSVRTTNSR
jgi:hypothetical protein